LSLAVHRPTIEFLLSVVKGQSLRGESSSGRCFFAVLISDISKTPGNARNANDGAPA
jgi:hypothetical protein